MNIIDKMAYTNALVNRSPFAKVFFGLGALISSMVFDNTIWHIVLFIIMSAYIVGMAKIPLTTYRKVLKLPIGFIIISMITIMISFSRGNPGYLAYFPIGAVNIGFTGQGIDMAKTVFFRSLCALSAMYSIALTTPVPQWAKVFKEIHLPSAFIDMLILIYRFITIFIETFSTMELSIRLRGGYRTWRVQIENMGHLGYHLFKEVMDSYESWQQALDLKLYNGEFYF